MTTHTILTVILIVIAVAAVIAYVTRDRSKDAEKEQSAWWG
jgi:heme/copper-type cytochrome/quinol oxidase subunit 2